MDAKARTGLIDSLAVAKTFENSYNEVNRRRKIGKILRLYEARDDAANANDRWITRPKVDFDSRYTSVLAVSGAI